MDREESLELLAMADKISSVERARRTAANMQQIIEEAAKAPIFNGEDVRYAVQYFNAEEAQPINTTSRMSALAAYVAAYDKELLRDATSMRTFVVNRLMEMSITAKSEANQLRALELLGKAAAMFVDRHEVKNTQEHKFSVDDLRKRLQSLHATDVIDLRNKHDDATSS